jgi:thioester reductase-like protein
MPLTVLITGGSGYLGQFLVEEFAKTDRVRLSLLLRLS